MDKKHKIIMGDILSLLIILSAVVYLFSDILVNKKIILGGDLTLANYPTHTAYAEELKQFKISLWNPYIGLGYPSFAETVNSMLHPINLVSFFFFSITAGMTISLLLCVLFSCIFMYIYARKVNMGYSASIFCAFAFALGTNFTGHFISMGAFIKVIMFLPLILYCIERMLINSNFKNMTFLSISLALMIIGGHPQGVFYSLLASGMYIALNIFICDLTFKNKLLLLRDFAFVYIMSFGLAAIQLIPTYELKYLSVRARRSLDATSGPMYISWIKYMLWPNRASAFQIDILPLILSFLGILRIRKDRRALFYLLLLLFFFAMSFGKKLLPLYLCEVLNYLPGFNYFRYCHRYIFIAIFFLILLSGKGLDFVINIISKIRIYRFIQLGLKCFIALSIPLVFFINLKKADEATTSGHPGSNNYNKIRYYDYLNVSEGALLKLLKKLQQQNELMRVVTDFSSYTPDSHLPENLLAQFKIPSFCINSGFYVALNLSYIQQLANEVFLSRRYEILDPLGINYLVTHSEIPFSSGWELIFRGVDYNFNLITESWVSRDREIFVFKNKKAFPRIFMVSNVDGDLIKPEKLEDTSLKYNIKVLELLSDKVTLKTSQNRDAFLVMNDTYYPGWEACVDGEKTKIYLANRVCRAVFVPSGKHFIEFKYNPFSFRIGRYITMTTILIMLFLALRANLKLW